MSLLSTFNCGPPCQMVLGNISQRWALSDYSLLITWWVQLTSGKQSCFTSVQICFKFPLLLLNLIWSWFQKSFYIKALYILHIAMFLTKHATGLLKTWAWVMQSNVCVVQVYLDVFPLAVVLPFLSCRVNVYAYLKPDDTVFCLFCFFSFQTLHSQTANHFFPSVLPNCILAIFSVSGHIIKLHLVEQCKKTKSRKSLLRQNLTMPGGCSQCCLRSMWGIKRALWKK